MLLKLVQGFYKKEFWDCWKCGDLPDALAHELFEQSINLGHPRTCRHLQQVLNALNRALAQERRDSDVLSLSAGQ